MPPDIPPYHLHGFVHEMAPEARARLWDAALVAMAGVHRLDPEQLGLGFVDQPEYGRAGSAQQLAAYERHLRDHLPPAQEPRLTVEAPVWPVPRRAPAPTRFARRRPVL